ncbi:hypothetical protein MMC13_002175 [Lambiella insularis]|nr:hypothetical protein [Lambiella insularis]
MGKTSPAPESSLDFGAIYRPVRADTFIPFSDFFTVALDVLWFTDTIPTYSIIAVLSNCRRGSDQMEKAADLDGLLHVLQDHIKRLDDLCLLSPRLASTPQATVSIPNSARIFSNILASPSRRSDTPFTSSTKPQHVDSEQSSGDTEDDKAGNSSDNEDASQDLASLRSLASSFDNLLGLRADGAARREQDRCRAVLGHSGRGIGCGRKDLMALGTKGNCFTNGTAGPAHIKF